MAPKSYTKFARNILQDPAKPCETAHNAAFPDSKPPQLLRIYYCQRQFEIVRKRRRNFVVFRRGGNKTKRFLAQKECSRFAVSGA